MADYRVFLLDEHNHIVGVQIVTRGSDGEALAGAVEFVKNQRGVEVWELARLVGKIPARQLEASGD
jgi:hypothetical protein